MDTWVWFVIVAAAAVVILAAIWLVSSRRRRDRDRLRERFGPEYDRTAELEGERKAQRELAEREQERERLDIRPLTGAARARYVQQWEAAQARFVDDPRGAAADADRIVRGVLSERGYPVDDDLDRSIAPLSVDHPEVIERYRHGHGTLTGIDEDRGEGNGDVTEGLREAMLDFRLVFEALVDEQPERTHA
jgi:hypothetical protein